MSGPPATDLESDGPGHVLDLDSPVADRLLLESLPGAVDYLTADLADLAASRDDVAATVVRRFPEALVVDWSGPLRPLAAIRFYSGCAVWLHDVETDEIDARDLDAWAAASRERGVLGLVERAGRPTFRVAADLAAARWPVRDHLESAWSWENDPGRWQLNVRRHRDAVVCEVGALYQTARFGRMARIPASTTPVVAAVLARLLKPEPGQLVLDPFCGAGTNLLTVAALEPRAVLLAADVHPVALAAARGNLAQLDPRCHVVRADATRLPLADGSVDRVVANLPFGKRVGSHGVNVGLYPAFLRQLTRVLGGRGRAVLLTEDKRILVDAIQRTANLRVLKEVQLETGGLHPTAYVVTRGRSRRGPSRGARQGQEPAT